MDSFFSIVNDQSNSKSMSIEDDFLYGSNVANSHVYIRLGFLRKVYGILTAQLSLTFLIGLTFVLSQTVEAFALRNSWILGVTAIASIGLIIALSIKGREIPINYYLLAAFTFCESILVGFIVAVYNVSSVLEAVALTMCVTLSLTFYTLQSKRDFSSMGAGLFAALWIMILLGFMQFFFPSEGFERYLAGAGAVLFSLFIIFDTHMIMTKFSPEDYIPASVNLYLDIINLFIYILRAVGEKKN